LSEQTSSVLKLSLTELREIPGNVNEMSDADFNSLCDGIKESGFCPALVVAPREGKYVIIDGNHRFRAVRLLGWTEVSCQVIPVDDVTAQEILSARMNIVRGNVDKVMFSKLWNKIRGVLDERQAMYTLGIASEEKLREFMKLPRRRLDIQIGADEQVKALMKRVPAVEDMIAIVRAALGDCDTGEFDHLAFQVRSTELVMVRCTRAQLDMLRDAMAVIKRKGLPLAESIVSALSDTYRECN